MTARSTQPVAVEVARGDAHAGLIGPRGIARHAGSVPHLLESHPAHVAEQKVGGGVIGDEKVHPAIVVEVGGDDAEAAAVAVDDPRVRRHIDETARVIAEQVVGQGLGVEWVAVDVGIIGGVATESRVFEVPGRVVADVEVKVAVAVEVGQSRRRRPIPVTAQAGAGR